MGEDTTRRGYSLETIHECLPLDLEYSIKPSIATNRARSAQKECAARCTASQCIRCPGRCTCRTGPTGGAIDETDLLDSDCSRVMSSIRPLGVEHQPDRLREGALVELLFQARPVAGE